MVYLMEFEIDKTYYYYSPVIGIFELFFIEVNTEGVFIFNNIKNEKFRFNKNTIEFVKESHDLSIIYFNQNEINTLNKNIKFYKKKLKNLNIKLAEYEKNQQKFKEKYPEEFI